MLSKTLALGMLLTILTSTAQAKISKLTTDTEMLPYKEALLEKLSNFEKNYNCNNSHGGIIPSSDGLMIPSIINAASSILIDNSGSQPAILVEVRMTQSIFSKQISRYLVSFKTTADYTDIESVTMESQRSIKINSGTLIQPIVQDGYETTKTIECVKK